MRLKNTSKAYGSIAKFFHWTIFVLLLGMIIYGFLLDDIPKPYQSFNYNLHKLIGILILFLMLARLWWLIRDPKPKKVGPKWEKWLESFVHYSLYVVVIAMPLSGCIGSLAGGHPPHLGNVNLMLPVAKDNALDEAAFDVHGTLAYLIIALVSVHALAALFHHFIRKDDVLRRMLPNSGA